MTNIYGDPKKHVRKVELFDIAVQELQNAGYTVGRIPRSGKSSLRLLTKDRKSVVATIRTTQDTWIAFPRNDDDTAWNTLKEAEVVVAASVDDRDNPRNANIHIIPADEMRARFDRSREAKIKAGHVMPKGRGVWLSLYDKEANHPVSHVGAGAGIAYPPIATVPLDGTGQAPETKVQPPIQTSTQERFTIADAKRKLAAFYEVPEAAITITISN